MRERRQIKGGASVGNRAPDEWRIDEQTSLVSLIGHC